MFALLHRRLRCGLHAWKDRRGAVAVTFAISFLAMFVLLSLVIDYGRMLSLQTRGQAALDGAMLHALNDRTATDKAAFAKTMFLASLVGDMPSDTAFTYDSTNRSLSATATFNMPLTLGSAWNAATAVSIAASTKATGDRVRALDLALCFNAGSRSANTIAFAQSLLNDFAGQLDAELSKRGIPSIDQVRVRPIFYRDYGGYLTQAVSDNASSNLTLGAIVAQITLSGLAVGDVPALTMPAGFYDVTSARSSGATGLAQFVRSQTASGGGDAPDSGMECVNEAMDSPWANVGDRTSSGKAIEVVYPIIGVFPDAAAHPLSFEYSLANWSYPPESQMPRTEANFAAKWAQLKTARSGTSLYFCGGFAQHPLVFEPDGSSTSVQNGFKLLASLSGYVAVTTATWASCDPTKFMPALVSAFSNSSSQTIVSK